MAYSCVPVLCGHRLLQWLTVACLFCVATVIAALLQWLTVACLFVPGAIQMVWDELSEEQRRPWLDKAATAQQAFEVRRERQREQQLREQQLQQHQQQLQGSPQPTQVSAT